MINVTSTTVKKRIIVVRSIIIMNRTQEVLIKPVAWIAYYGDQN